MKFYISILIVFISGIVSGQSAIYNFNDCSLSEASGNYNDATTVGTLDCECGVIENALYLDGNLDNIVFDEKIDSLMEGDFTLSFYFRQEPSSLLTDIFSIRSACNFDSLLAFKYVPNSNQFLLELANNIGSLQQFQVQRDNAVCWHRFVLTKVGLEYSWYMDGELAASYVAPTTIVFGSSARAAFANSPCLAINEERFRGWLDEVTFLDRGLTSVQLTANDLRPDQVITNDTTIVQGESVDIFTGPTCATDWTWSPTATILNPSDLDITVTPDETTEYTISFTNPGGCITEDNITVFVLDDDALDCNNLLLPNAFTPNGDLLNDTYGIANKFLVEDITYFEIYDRWGAKVWETAEKEGTWDGTFQGTRVNPAMYLYKIKYTCKGEEYVKVDNFSVLR